MNTRHILPILFLISPLMAVADNSDCTDQAGDCAAINNPPVIVSAMRWETSGIPTANSINVITRDEIRQSGADNIIDVLRGQGGVQIQDFTGDGSRAVIDMRGFGESGLSNTLVLIDGRRLNPTDLSGPNLNLVALKDVERIEITRGSNTVLYGDQAVGGVVNIITRRPAARAQADIEVGYGSHDYQSQRFQASRRLDNGVAGRISAERRKSGNYRDNADLDFTNGFAQLSYDGKAGNVFLDITRTDEDIQLPGALFPAELAVSRKQSTGSGAFNDSVSEAIRLGGTYTLNEHWDIAGEFTLRSEDVDGALNFAGALFPFQQKRLHKSWNPRIRGRIPAGDQVITVIAGGDIEESDYAINGVTLTDSTQSLESIYVLATLPLHEYVAVTAGARKAWVENDIFDGFRFPAGAELRDDQTATTIGISLTPTPDLRLFAKREETFRFPLIDEETNFFGVQQTLLTQTGKSYETGIEWHNNWIDASLLVYQLDLKNELIFNPITFQNENLDETKRRGVIHEISVYPTGNLSLDARYTYTNARFDAGMFEDERIPLVSRHQLQLSASYRFMQYWNLYSDLTLRSDRVMGSDFSNTADRLPGYGLLNINLKFENRDYFISAGVRNLLDKEYLSTGSLAFNPATFQTEPGVYPAPERQFLITGGIHF